MTKIVWDNRYSGTDDSDDLGRWARVGYLDHKSLDPFKREQIAWINKINGKYTAYVYLGSGKFSNAFDTEEQAKNYCEQVINDFKDYYLVNSKETEIKPELYTLLTSGFGDDDSVEGVFLIEAKTEQTFFNRKQKLAEITGFSDGGFDSYEQDEDGGSWKIITTAFFETIEDLKNAIKKMEKYNWLYLLDTSIMFDSEYLYCEGKWFV